MKIWKLAESASRGYRQLKEWSKHENAYANNSDTPSEMGVEKPRREVLTYNRGLVACYIIEYCLSRTSSQKIMDDGKRVSQQSRQKR